MKKFWLKRIEDFSGISGTGIVAEGVIFSNGKAILSWLTILCKECHQEFHKIYGNHNNETQLKEFLK